MDNQLFAQMLSDAFEDAQVLVLGEPGEDYPPLVLFHPAKGMVSFDWSTGEDDADLDQRRELRTASRAFVTDSDNANKVPRTQFLLPVDAGTEYVLRVVGNLEDKEIEPSLHASILQEFQASGWVFETREVVEDHGLDDREEQRVQLDEIQAEIASGESAEMLVLSGPAGSGKSLVLARRAEHLSRQNPHWNLVFLCFNKGLVPYLEGLVSHLPNVSVWTFASWLQHKGYRLNTKNCVSSAIGLDRLKRVGIDRDIDGLLVDEYQDFCPAWLELMFESVVPGRGGIVLAGDSQQSLYQDLDIAGVLEGREAEHRRLEIPYRSTRQILEVAGILDPAQAVPGIEHAPEGEPVEVVWSPGTVNDKAEAIAHIILQHRKRKRMWSEFAVLTTINHLIGPITRALADLGVTAEARYSRRIGPDDDPWSNSVKVMTIHTAKGLEYSIVFVVGLDELTEPSEKDPPEREEAERFVRVNLVGPTRAKDLLYLVASKDNAYIRRVKEQSERLEIHRWPEDYVGVDGG